jgi:hypothetical protein
MSLWNMLKAVLLLALMPKSKESIIGNDEDEQRRST